MMKQELFFQSLQERMAKSAFADRKLTLGEIVDLAENLGVRMSDIVIAEAMAAHHMTHDEVIEAVLGASTKDIKAYHNVLGEIARRRIAVEIRHVTAPEVQRIRIEARESSAFVDALNRGGGRLKLVDAEPTLAAAQAAAARLGIKLAEV